MDIPVEGKIEAYQELIRKFDQKKATTLRKLAASLDDPYSGNTGGTVVNELGQIVQVKGKKKRDNKNDPIRKILRTN